MKTPVRAEVLEQLAKINDQLRFFLFAEHELLDRLSDFSPRLQDFFTSDVFARNVQAPRIHVRLKDLPAFQQATRSFTFGAYVSMGYEVASTFFERAVRLACACGLTIAAPGDKAPERKYVQHLTTAGVPQPPSDAIHLVTFVRLRRNGFIHRHAAVDSAYASFARTQGPSLNLRWQRARDVVDFQQPTAGDFCEAEAIAFLKLLRIAVADLDEHLATILGEANIVTLLTRQKFGHEARHVTVDVARIRSRKIASLVRSQFGFVPSEAVVDHAVRTIGVR